VLSHDLESHPLVFTPDVPLKSILKKRKNEKFPARIRMDGFCCGMKGICRKSYLQGVFARMVRKPSPQNPGGFSFL
jgi:hypothetical protein